MQTGIFEWLGSMESDENKTSHYEAITRGIRVLVMPHFMDGQSVPENDHFVWAYEVEIVNEGQISVQLRERTWLITDANGKREKVHGPGVVGEQPILNPGDTFRYSSGCPLTTSSGFMVGCYTMSDESGNRFDIDIPAFSLDLPGQRGTVN